MTTLPSCLWQATVSRGRDRALVAAKPVCPPLRSSRLDRSACVSSSHTSASHLRGSPETPRTMGHFQVRKWQRAHRALCKKALAHPLHRGGYGRRRKSGNDLSQSKTQALLRTRIPRLYNPPASLCSAPSLTQGRLWEGNRSPLEKAPSSRQGGLVCGALRLPHDPMRLPLLFPQNSPCDFCGSPVFYSLSLISGIRRVMRQLPREGAYNKEKDPWGHGSFRC